MIVLFAARNTFEETQRAALEALRPNMFDALQFDNALCALQLSARSQGFEAIRVMSGGERWHGQYVGADAYAIHGTWYAFKNVATEADAIARAMQWWDAKPDHRTVYGAATDAAPSGVPT